MAKGYEKLARNYFIGNNNVIKNLMWESFSSVSFAYIYDNKSLSFLLSSLGEKCDRETDIQDKNNISPKHTARNIFK